MLGLQPFKYSQVLRTSTDDIHDIEIDQLQKTSHSYAKVCYSRKSWIWHYLVSSAIIASSYIAVFFAGSMKNSGTDQKCLRHTSTYSPLFKHMSAELKLTQFNGTVGRASTFTGDPSPELDATWGEYSNVKFSSISAEEFEKMEGADDAFKDSARLTPEYGGGYVGYLWFSHEMHCLDMLRKSLHPEYYNDPSHPEHMAEHFTDRPHTVKLHIQHCVEMLRQSIMCNVDVGFVPHVWISASPVPFDNFNTFHKCRDIESVKRWIKESEIPDVPNGGPLPKPPGSKIFPVPP